MDGFVLMRLYYNVLEGYENLQGTVDWFDFFGIPSVFIIHEFMITY